MSDFTKITKYGDLFNQKNAIYIIYRYTSQIIQSYAYVNDLAKFQSIMTKYDVINDVILCRISQKEKIWRCVRQENHTISILQVFTMDFYILDTNTETHGFHPKIINFQGYFNDLAKFLCIMMPYDAIKLFLYSS